MNLKILYRMSVFQKVAETGSFTRAAQDLNLSKSVVSQHVAELERDLKVSLISRSTRSASLTREGLRLADAASNILNVAQTALKEIEQEQSRPSGLIRVTASQNFISTYLVGAVLRFRQTFPEIEVEIDSSDTITNIIETGHDVAFRIGWLKSSDLHALKICSFSMIACASPLHIERHGAAIVPSDLARRPWVAITIMSDFDRVALTTAEGDEATIPISPVMRTNSGMTARQIVLGGDCVGLLPDYAVEEDLEAGRLVRLLPAWSHRPGEIAAIYPHKKRPPPRLRAFLDFLKEDTRRQLRS